MTKALVIGGGIAGPVAAMALQKVGIESVVYERYPEATDRRGVFLTLGSNGLAALETLDAADGAVAKGFPTSEISLRSTTGKMLGVTPIGVELENGLTSQGVRRADLYASLHGEAKARGLQIEYGKKAVGFEEFESGVRVTFADGSVAEGDIAIGCDGIHSKLRNAIDPKAPAPVYAGLVGLGGYAQGVRLDIATGGYEMIFGKKAFFGYAVAPNEDVWWFANIPRSDEPAPGEVEGIDEQEWRAYLMDLFAEDAGPAIRLIEATPTIGNASPVHSIPHLPTWHTDRMVVIGDAAHAPSPTSGQGASLAIEDAIVLAKCLRDTAAPASAFALYEEIRRPRVEEIISNAAKINNNKAANGITRVLRDLFLPMILKVVAKSSQLEKTYGHRIAWDEKVTQTV